MKWKFANSQSITFGYGKHSQLQSLSLYLVDIEDSENGKEPVNKDLDFNKSQHFVISYDNLPVKDLRLKIDLYYQYLWSIPIPKDTAGNDYLKSYSSINDVNGFADESLENRGRGENYGIEFSVEKFFSKGWYALLTASLYESKYTAKDGIKRNTRFNGNYICNVLGGKEFMIKNNILGANIKYSLVGGRKYAPIKGVQVLRDKNGDPVINQLTGKEVIVPQTDWANVFSLKLKDYSRLDMSIFYRVNKPKLAHVLTVEIQNILNTQNIGGFSYYDTRVHDYMFWYQSGLIPIFKYRVEF